jgi:hypothetical protein
MPLSETLKSGQQQIHVLIPQSGTQFLDFEFEVDPRRKPPGFIDPQGQLDSGPPPMRIEEPDENDRVSKRIQEDYVIKIEQLVKMFDRIWMPIPLLRKEGSGQHHHGPTNWTRAQLIQTNVDDRGARHFRLVLAVDTSLLTQRESEAYLAPQKEDAKAGRQFELPEPNQAIDWYLEQPWIRKWCLGVYRDMAQRELQIRENKRAEKKHEPPRRVDPPDDGKLHEFMIEYGGGSNHHLSHYRALLALIVGEVPLIRLEDIFTGSAQEPIDVTLVLDLGNSRSCGLLIEEDRSSEHQQAFKGTARLQVRDLTHVEMVYSDPFPSRVEFARAHFGPEGASRDSGRDDAFNWPSPTRVGVEAVRLASNRTATEGPTGLSTPKRYLWDDSLATEPWRFSGQQGPHSSGQDYAIDVPLTALINESGKALHRVDPDAPDSERLPALYARYARQNLASFSIAEIVTQSMSYINSVAYRQRKQGNNSRPRRLHRLIMTIPAAMPIEERLILEQQAKAGCELAFIGLGLADLDYSDPLLPRLVPPASDAGERSVQGEMPKVDLQWDEATATQAVYLYSEIAESRSGDARAFFRDMALPQKRLGPEPVNSLRLATLDIGGGTTDLVISNLEAEGTGTNLSIIPAPLFREGFNVAGDDALLKVIVDHVYEPLLATLAAETSRDRADQVLKRILGPDHAERRAEDLLLKQQFTQAVAAPIALKMIAAYENFSRNDPRCDPAHEQFDAGHPGARAERRLTDFFDSETPLRRDVIAQFDRRISHALGIDFKLERLSFVIDPSAIDQSIRALFTEMLHAMAHMVWRYRADVLILSGRASKFPAVQAMLTESGALAPHRIIPLHQFRVGSWYPFHDADLRIGDPKTTAAVGAMLCVLGNGLLDNFNIQTARLQPRSTARYFGKLTNQDRLPAADVLYGDLRRDDEEYQIADEEPFPFWNTMALGFRQVAEDWWPATHLYSLGYSDSRDAQEYNDRTPLQVTLKIRSSIRELHGGKRERIRSTLVVHRVTDKDGRTLPADTLKMRLQTLADRSGYWTDTGILKKG